MWWHGPGDWLWMTVAMVAWWTFVILVIAWVIRALGSGRARRDDSGGGGPPRDSVEDAAWRAYRRGEVDREGLMRLLEQIEESKGRPPRSEGT